LCIQSASHPPQSRQQAEELSEYGRGHPDIARFNSNFSNKYDGIQKSSTIATKFAHMNAA